MQMFVDNGVAEDDPRMSAVYEHFEGNLRDIVDTLMPRYARCALHGAG